MKHSFKTLFVVGAALASQASFAAVQKINCRSQDGHSLIMTLQAASADALLHSTDPSVGSVTLRGKNKKIIGQKNILVSVDAVLGADTDLTNEVESTAELPYREIYSTPLALKMPTQAFNVDKGVFNIQVDFTPNPDVEGGAAADGYMGDMSCVSEIR